MESVSRSRNEGLLRFVEVALSVHLYYLKPTERREAWSGDGVTLGYLLRDRHERAIGEAYRELLHGLPFPVGGPTPTQMKLPRHWKSVLNERCVPYQQKGRASHLDDA